MTGKLLLLPNTSDRCAMTHVVGHEINYVWWWKLARKIKTTIIVNVS